MTPNNRAKAFIRIKLKRAALIILPLAAVAVEAHASIIFTPPVGGQPFGANGATTNVTMSFSSAQIWNGVNGISLFGAAVYTSTTSGAGSNGSVVCQDVCAGFAASGVGSGTFDSSTLLTDFDFQVTDSNGAPLQWFTEVDLNGYSGLTEGTTTAGGGEVTGSFSMFVPQGGTLTGWRAELLVGFGGPFNIGDTITLNIPSGSSVDIGVSSVPEPGTGLLLAMACAGLAGAQSIRQRLS
jgi:hypothetical protein